MQPFYLFTPEAIVMIREIMAVQTKTNFYQMSQGFPAMLSCVVYLIVQTEVVAINFLEMLS